MEPLLPAHEVGLVFAEHRADVLDVAQIHEPVAGATVGVWRVTASGRSVVLKVLAHSERGHANWRTSADAADWMYWRREACIFESTLFDTLPAGVRAPECHLVAERGDGSVAIWLEDVVGASADFWPLERYRDAARHLGRWQGECAVVRPSDARWLSRHWLRAYLEQRDGDDELLASDAPWSHPLLVDVFDVDDIERMRSMRADRPRFLDWVERLPATLCHLDMHPRNLFDAPAGVTCIIDWAYAGVGGIGEDVGNLVPDSVLDFHVPPGDIGVLDQLVTDGYRQGVTESGLTIEPSQIRLGMVAAMAAKYAWIGPATARAAAEERTTLNGRPIEEAIRVWAPTVRYLLDRADEARELASRR
jgi:hypothetical protein